MVTKAFKNILRYEKVQQAYARVLTNEHRETIRQNEKLLAVDVPGARKNGSVGDPGVRFWVNPQTGLVKRAHKHVASMFLANVLRVDPSDKYKVYAVLGPYGHEKQALRKNGVASLTGRRRRRDSSFVDDDGTEHVFVPMSPEKEWRLRSRKDSLELSARDLLAEKYQIWEEGEDEDYLVALGILKPTDD